MKKDKFLTCRWNYIISLLQGTMVPKNWTTYEMKTDALVQMWCDKMRKHV
jgi:hypothetical protein